MAGSHDAGSYLPAHFHLIGLLAAKCARTVSPAAHFSARIDPVYPASSGGSSAFGVYAHKRLFDYGMHRRQHAYGISRGRIAR